MRIVIAEDSVLLRAGLTRILADAGEEVVATVGAADELMAAVERHQPDLCIVDVRMPPTHTDDGLRAAIAIRQRWPKIGILVLSQYVEERYATDLLAGETTSIGYLLKDRVADVSEFLAAVRRVGDGGTALDPEVVAQLLARARRRDPLERLTPREREVLALMAEGRSNPAIARSLVVTDKAVEKHVSNIFTKLDLPPAEDDHRRVLAVLQWVQELTMTNVMDRPPPAAAAATERPPPAPASRRRAAPPAGVRRAVAGVRRRARRRPAWRGATYNVVVAARPRGAGRDASRSRPPALTAIDVRNSAGLGAHRRPPTATRSTCGPRSATGCGATGERQEVVGDVLELRGTCPNFGSDWCRVNYEIAVPRDARRSSVDADDGSVDVDRHRPAPSTSTATTARSSSTDVSGPLAASTDNGRIEGTDLRSPTVDRRHRQRPGRRWSSPPPRRRSWRRPTTARSRSSCPTTARPTALDVSTRTTAARTQRRPRRPRQPPLDHHPDRQRQRHRPHRRLTPTGSEPKSRPDPRAGIDPFAQIRPSGLTWSVRRTRCRRRRWRRGWPGRRRRPSRRGRGCSASVRWAMMAHDAAGGEAVDGAHLEQRPGLHLEVEDAEVVVLVDHPPQPPQQARVGRRRRALLALEERVGRRHHADVVVDAERAGPRRPARR